MKTNFTNVTSSAKKMWCEMAMCNEVSPIQGEGGL